jgi:guanylate kinase
VKPRIVVLSAPSGGGKTTIARAVRERFPDRFGFSVSATTRKARPREKHGVDYYFWDRKTFKKALDAGEFLEHAEYAGELYGTLKTEVDKVLASGKHVLLDIEVEGAGQVRKKYPSPASISIFILPKDPEVLLARLRKRETESASEIVERITRAKHELQQSIGFDRVVWNDVLEDAIREVTNIADAEAGYQREVPFTINWVDKYAYKLQELAKNAYDETHQQKG